MYELGPFFDFISSLPFIDATRIAAAKAGNWHFETSIPLGYGLGSSGCLCAACYDSFGIPSTDYLVIKEHLAAMEGFFHGTSSGLDPLTIYLNRPLRLSRQGIEVLEKPIDTSLVRVLDSGIHRNAKVFIGLFKDKKATDSVFQEALSRLDALNSAAIERLTNGKSDFDIFQSISALQYDHFQEMIPDIIKPVWRKGLDSGDFAMKLSGAGGGGCFLLFLNETNANVTDFGFKVLPV